MTISTLADICGILGFLVSLIAIGGVIKINKKINSTNMTVQDTHVGGDITGRDKTVS